MLTFKLYGLLVAFAAFAFALEPDIPESGLGVAELMGDSGSRMISSASGSSMIFWLT